LTKAAPEATPTSNCTPRDPPITTIVLFLHTATVVEKKHSISGCAHGLDPT